MSLLRVKRGTGLMLWEDLDQYRMGRTDILVRSVQVEGMSYYMHEHLPKKQERLEIYTFLLTPEGYHGLAQGDADWSSYLHADLSTILPTRRAPRITSATTLPSVARVTNMGLTRFLFALVCVSAWRYV